ncbi:hypothetical protein [Corynebacterium poyangense]|nr:hypothetical protein [Corynebacterium poyangense]
MYSKFFATLRQRAVGWRFVAFLGIIPSIFAAVFIAPLVGEAQWPEIG